MTRAIRTRTAAFLTAGFAAGTLLVGTPPAAAVAVCDGDYVRTCIDLVTDGYYFTPSASIRDTEIGSDYAVGVKDLVLQRRQGDTWTFWYTVAKDRDGLHDVYDSIRGDSSYCKGYGDETLRAKATMRWRRAGSETVTTETVYSRVITRSCWNG